jgi:hypothetical protein
MAETVTLTTPITKPSQTTVRLERMILDIETKSITIQWLGTNNEAGSAVYPTPGPADHPAQPTGATLLNQLNTANLSTKSLVKRVLERLQTDGYLPAGTISGTPD